MTLSDTYKQIRQRSEQICSLLQTEDYVVQPIVDVSPPKWHLGHTTWFFETFILKPYFTSYQEYNPDYNYVFNSYYETVGARVIRTDRGNLGNTGLFTFNAFAQAVEFFHHLSPRCFDTFSEFLRIVTGSNKTVGLL